MLRSPDAEMRRLLRLEKQALAHRKRGWSSGNQALMRRALKPELAVHEKLLALGKAGTMSGFELRPSLNDRMRHRSAFFFGRGALCRAHRPHDAFGAGKAPIVLVQRAACVVDRLRWTRQIRAAGPR